MNFKRAVLGMVVVSVMLLLIAVVAIKKSVNGADDYIKEIKVNVGESVVFEGDTVTIIDYSIFESTYILSNDKVVSFEYAEKLLIKKN